MNKNILQTLVFPAVLFSLLIGGNVALSSEVTGNLTTGISSGTTVNGVVIAPPTSSPTAGTYTSAQSVGLTASGASNVRYTLDGTNPNCSSGTLYSSPLAVTSSQTIKAISCYPESKSSTVATYAYTINIPTASSGGGGGGGGGGSGGSPVVTTPNVAHGISGFVNLMANWGKTGVGLTSDFNGDGKVDILDFVLLMTNWLK